MGSFQTSLPCPLVKKVLPFFLHAPETEVPRACGALRGVQSRVWEASGSWPLALLACWQAASTGKSAFPHPWDPLLTPFPSRLSPLSRVPSPHCQFPVAFLPSAPFLFYHPSSLYRLATPPASPFSEQPLHPFPSGPNTPLPPAPQTDESKLSGITSFEPGLLFFFPRPPDEKLGDTLRRPLYVVPRVTGAVFRNGVGEKGKALPPSFSHACPPQAGSPRLTP